MRLPILVLFMLAWIGLAKADPFFNFSREPFGVSEDEFQHYKRLNDQESLLKDFKDADETLRIKIAQLHTINQNRKRFRLQELQLDILASRVGNKQAKEAAQGSFYGHYNLRGETPYQRYAFAGGVDHVGENAELDRRWHVRSHCRECTLDDARRPPEHV